MKKNSLNVDASIAFYNLNVKPKTEPNMTRLDLGKKLFPDFTDATIHSILSHWANGSSRNMPSVSDIKAIAKATKAPLELILNV